MMFKLFKKKGRNLTFIITLKPPIPYPSQETRWKIYGAPLNRIFAGYFDETSIEWFKDNKGKLYLIIVACYGAKFSYNKDEEYAYTGYLVQTLSTEIENFFNQFKTKAVIEDLVELIPQTLMEYLAIAELAKTDPKNYKPSTLYREIDYPQRKYDYIIYKSEEKGKAIEMAKDYLEIVTKNGGKNCRINSKHPNVIETKDGKTGKWLPAIVCIDPTTLYTPKGEKEHMVELSK